MEANREALGALSQGDRARPWSGVRLWHGRVVLRTAKSEWLDEIEPVPETAEATRLARKAVHLGGDDPVALYMGAYALAFAAQEFDDAAAFMDRGLAVSPNLGPGLAA